MGVPEGLQKLLEDGVIDEVQQRLMSGKEASVYVVSHRGAIVAAKVYKARDRRTFKSTSSYTEGRNQTRNTRDKRAMDRRSSYGKELMEESWRDMEYRALFDAHNAGVRVPKPIMIYEDVLLMELLVDANDAPAPRLADIDLDGEQARAMLTEVYRQVRLLLAAGRVHGDLSAFNILMAAAGPTLIDLPQVLDAVGNNHARNILTRDLRNVVEHLTRYDERLLRFVDCGEALFQHFQRGTLDQATEPREVRREHSGGRHTRGEERKDGFVSQPRRGPPQQQRGPRQFDGPPQQHRGPQQQHRGPQQHAGPQQQHRGPQQHAGPQQQHRRPEGPQQQRGPQQQHRRPEGPQQQRGPEGPQQQHGGPQQRDPQQRGGPQQQRSAHAQEQRGPQFRGGGPAQYGNRQNDHPNDRANGPPRNGAPQHPDRGPARPGPQTDPRDARDRPPEVDVLRRRNRVS